MDADKNVRLNLGLVLSIVLIAIPSFAWMVGYDFSGMSNLPIIFTVLMKVGSFGGMAMFAWSLILSGRYKTFDTMFGGLDKVYIAHRFFGTASIALLLLHPLGYTFLHLYYEGATDLFNHFLGFKSIAFTLGRLSLYGLMLVGVWSIFTKAKHETFIVIHRWLGVLFIVGAVHAFMSGPESVLATNTFMLWYMAALTVVASLTFIHYSLLSDVLHPHYTYSVSAIKSLPDEVWELRLKPRYRIINFTPGQFVYISFGSMADDGYHPFTIASGNRSSELVFYIKELGDLTTKLGELKPNDTVKVKGPFGGFTFDDRRYPNQLWIAGGIGITPFLAKARSLMYAKQIPEVELVYMIGDESKAFAYQELYEIEQKTSAFNVTLVDEQSFGRQDLKDLSEHFGGLDDWAIYLCGPPGMIKAYSEQVQELGLEDNLHFEEFFY